ncbi:MAG: response regulator [Sphingobacteriales bacterium]|nr:response regulator [Sphingobacteriales bacterium]
MNLNKQLDSHIAACLPETYREDPVIKKFIGAIQESCDLQHKIQGQEVRDLQEVAAESAEAKEIFLANMSHEIRTPMNAIIGMGRQLSRTNLDEQQQFYLETISKAAEHLLVLINDILDISKIEAGKLNLVQTGFRPGEVIDHCLQVMKHKAEEKGLKLVKKNGPGLSTIFIGDPYRLTQVLQNLVSNAIKFTEQGSVTVSCLVQPEKDKKQIMMLTVTDTGIGMDPEFQASVFRKFTQEDRSTARKYGGTGLGMSISKQLAELMNGSIDVSSRKGEGTAITLTIPFTVGVAADIPDTQMAAADSSILKGKKILLVEDNEMNRLVATTLLNNYGAVTEEAHNGAEAIRAVKDGFYDLILMDVQMPVLNGFDATRIIRQELNEFIPIIALTANAIKGEAEKCLKAGMNDYISKPFGEEELVNAIAKWLGKEPDKFAAPPLPEMKNGESPRLYELTQLEKIASNNQSFIRKMVTLFTNQAPADLKEIREAFANGNLATVRSTAHRMKPSLDNMGIESLHGLIREIETWDDSHAPNDQLDKKIAELSHTISLVLDQLKENVLADTNQ